MLLHALQASARLGVASQADSLSLRLVLSWKNSSDWRILDSTTPTPVVGAFARKSRCTNLQERRSGRPIPRIAARAYVMNCGGIAHCAIGVPWSRSNRVAQIRVVVKAAGTGSSRRTIPRTTPQCC